MGLGPARDVSLSEARSKATDARRLLLEGRDPLEEQAQRKRSATRERTFREVAEHYITEQTPAWKDPRSAPMWRSSLDRHIYPLLGNRSIAQVQTEDVLAVLRPIWETPRRQPVACVGALSVFWITRTVIIGAKATTLRVGAVILPTFFPNQQPWQKSRIMRPCLSRSSFCVCATRATRRRCGSCRPFSLSDGGSFW